MTNTTNLPPLPEPVARMLEWCGPRPVPQWTLTARSFDEFPERLAAPNSPRAYWRSGENLYTAAQVEEIRRAAILAERGRCANVCENEATNKWSEAHTCAAAIREGDK